MKAWDIVGWAFQADLLCNNCMTEELIAQGRLSPAARDNTATVNVDLMIRTEALGFLDAIDSTVTPQPIFASSDSASDPCGFCNEPLKDA